jgi:integrase
MPTKNRILFTTAVIENLKPRNKRFSYYDSQIKYLLVEVMPRGTKIFRVRTIIESRERRFTIGEYPAISVDRARAEAVITFEKCGQKVDFKRQRQAQDRTLRELATLYFEEYANGRCKTAPEMKKDFERWFANELDKKLSRLDHEILQNRINKLSDEGKHKFAANKARDHVKAIFNWGFKRQYCEQNHAACLTGFRVQSRERFIQPEEFEPLLKAIAEYGDARMSDLFLLCLYTGARVGNVRAMRWEEFSPGLKTWRIPEPKNGTAQTIPLADEAINVLSRRQAVASHSPWVFPGGNLQNGFKTDMCIIETKKAWRSICKVAGITDLTIHDLRRSLGSWLAINGVNTATIQYALGHKTLVSAAIYQRVNNDAVRDSVNRVIQRMQEMAQQAKKEKGTD